jgi:8-oxo-dGTP pyrophosphatase MutT (NUDIX family)
MKMSFAVPADFEDFKEDLRGRLAARAVREIDEGSLRHASVMMLIMNKDNAPHVLLTRRTESVSSHKGQVSFPGGGIDEGDEDSLAAAYRETEEEVGIRRDRIEYLGRFDDYLSIAGFHVACHVGAVEYPYECAPNRNETESCFEAPLSMFVNAEYDRYELVNWQGRDYRVFYYHYGGYEIWGMTARILTDFGARICKD